jgi:hypothetical protein
MIGKMNWFGIHTLDDIGNAGERIQREDLVD